MIIRMHNMEIESFVNFLLSLNLKGKDSRMRTRFIRVLQERIILVKTEHQDLLLNHCNLKEDGKPIVIERDGKRVYDVIDRRAFNKEYAELMDEEFIIEVNETNRDMINLVSEAVLDCNIEFSGREALIYDRYCEIMEGEE